MHLVFWIGLSLGIAAVLALVFAVRLAPLGYEDDGGFHLGREPEPGGAGKRLSGGL